MTRSSSSSACPVTHCHAGCQEWVHLWLVKEICGEGVSLSSSWLWDEVTSVSSSSEGNMRWSCVSVSLSRAGKTKEILWEGKSVSLSGEGDLRGRWILIFVLWSRYWGVCGIIALFSVCVVCTIALICHLVFALCRCFCLFLHCEFIGNQRKTCRDLSVPSTYQYWVLAP